MKQTNNNSGLLNTINEIIENGRQEGVLQLYTEDLFYNGRTIKINGKEHVNFGSCSYLGLELDERLKTAAIEAIQKFGIQFSSSRTYMSNTLYKELEELVKQIFNTSVVLTPTTTLGHQAVIPVVVEPGDLIILDQQVHASVQYAALNLQNKGVPSMILRHNNMEDLETYLSKYSSDYKKIWYMADGIYSMYGDYIPLSEVLHLLERYPKLYLYVDDAHGMSWTGRNGRGFVLEERDLHPKMIVGTSFAKGFGTGGGAFLFYDAELAQKVKNCGGPLIFSGPNQIPVVAASIASAKIHLSSEICEKQNNLKDKIRYCHNLMVKLRLPVVSNPETPIKFIGLGLTRVGYNMVRRMIDAGFYCNLAIFPAVPETCTGLRFTITNHHTYKDIDNLVASLSKQLPECLEEEGRTTDDIVRAFRRVVDFSKNKLISIENRKINSGYRVQHETSIKFIPEKVWNNLLVNGNYDWKWLHFLEGCFTANERKEHNWTFHYYIIWKDEIPVLATFFTATINKDDMLFDAELSYKIELQRLSDPYYLCSKTLIMGSLLTEGQHLYIDRTAVDWREILMLLLDHVWSEQINEKANTLCLRDFDASDEELNDFLTKQGFIKANLPDNNIVTELNYYNEETFLSRFNSREKWYLKDNVLKYKKYFTDKVVSDLHEDQVETWYDLYKNTKGKSFELNTFDLPLSFFKEMARNRQCEIIELYLHLADEQMLVAVTFNLNTANNNYCGIIIGLDYNYLKSFGVYKQMLYKTVLRAGQLNAKNIMLGFTAANVKKKFGAKAHAQVAYFQMLDQYNLSVINAMSKNEVLIKKNA